LGEGKGGWLTVVHTSPATPFSCGSP